MAHDGIIVHQLFSSFRGSSGCHWLGAPLQEVILFYGDRETISNKVFSSLHSSHLYLLLLDWRHHQELNDLFKVSVKAGRKEIVMIICLLFGEIISWN